MYEGNHTHLCLQSIEAKLFSLPWFVFFGANQLMSCYSVSFSLWFDLVINIQNVKRAKSITAFLPLIFLNELQNPVTEFATVT